MSDSAMNSLIRMKSNCVWTVSMNFLKTIFYHFESFNLSNRISLSSSIFGLAPNSNVMWLREKNEVIDLLVPIFWYFFGLPRKVSSVFALKKNDLKHKRSTITNLRKLGRHRLHIVEEWFEHCQRVAQDRHVDAVLAAKRFRHFAAESHVMDNHVGYGLHLMVFACCPRFPVAKDSFTGGGKGKGFVVL